MTSFHFEGRDHRVGYCSLCETDVLFCAKCGNNTCNGGYGEVDGVECDVCPSVYRAADEFYRTKGPSDGASLGG